MNQPLSPKKYIQTRARKLPVTKCLVNKAWETTRITNVFVFRRHTTGTVTIGTYLVDLLCLGVKDTFFRFNVDEEDFLKGLPQGQYEEISYDLAHNIIFAGHDFALDYGIEPVADFAITRMILEEDSDAIPLIEIPVGDASGKPHLMENVPGQYSHALAMLRKNAGEGNYHYSVAGRAEELLDDGAEGDTSEEYTFDDFEKGTIMPRDAINLSLEQLMNKEAMASRTLVERTTLILETSLRVLNMQKPEYFNLGATDVMLDATRELKNAVDHLIGATEDETTALEQPVQEIYDMQNEILDLVAEERPALNDKIRELAATYREQPFHLINLYELLLTQGRSNPDYTLIEDRLAAIAQQFPITRLVLALAHALQPERNAADDYDDIRAADSLTALFPEATGFHPLEYYYFWLVKLAQAVYAEDIRESIRWYTKVAAVNIETLSMPKIQVDLNELIVPQLKLG